MKLQFKKRRFLPAALAIVVLVVGSGVAYAYWTAGGTGGGSGTAAGGTIPVTAIQTTLLAPMYPGLGAQTISGDISNTNSVAVYVTSVTASIGVVTPVGAGTCTASDFRLTDPIASVGAQVAPGLTVGAWTGPKIQFFNDPDNNQDGCKGATVNLVYSIP